MKVTEMTVRKSQRITVKDAGGNFNGQEFDISLTVASDSGQPLTEEEQQTAINHVKELLSKSLDIDPPALGAYIPTAQPQTQVKKPVETLAGLYTCDTCGNPAELRIGTTKTGKPWRGIFCLTDKTHPVRWIR